ncbi:MAG: bifunctional diaminohydroxyphosphoribosylaminopyrimidine deaminase/5-amino-6-(5-phosphoribosylamino)uracil reductase RibD [Flavobacteriales bacterium]|jgi:diaminohydroxyphosphoribosylaminopyrimidine deaminase/5-amino-6-(5-phosphoribosylamino)uracil reductase
MSDQNKHKLYMSRCIEIANKAKGRTYPNPNVGCVIVHNEKIISEGHSSIYGGPHAEVNAINKVKNKELLKFSTLYVTLEPCSHYGKTPPCCILISKYKIPNVVIGICDISSKVNGKGINHLKKNNTNIIVGVLEKECKELHKTFLHYNRNKKPFIILKWAETKDSFISPKLKIETKPFWISCKESRQLVHKWRSEEHSILIGHNTVIEDDPILNVRDFFGGNPIRIVIDKENTLNKSYKVFNNESETIVLDKETLDYSKNISDEICKFLYKKNILSVIVEGGRKTLDDFIINGNWDEARIFKSETILRDGLKAPKIYGKVISEKKIGTDNLIILKPL